MSLFLVVGEEDYGGDVRLFRHRKDADEYAESNRHSHKIVSNMYNVLSADDPTQSTFFVVVTEQWYGGGGENVAVFNTETAAKEYAAEFEMIDAVVLKVPLN